VSPVSSGIRRRRSGWRHDLDIARNHRRWNRRKRFRARAYRLARLRAAERDADQELALNF